MAYIISVRSVGGHRHPGPLHFFVMAGSHLTESRHLRSLEDDRIIGQSEGFKISRARWNDAAIVAREDNAHHQAVLPAIEDDFQPRVQLGEVFGRVGHEMLH